MPCYGPLNGFRSRYVNPDTGLRSITFSRTQALYPVEEQQVPCGQCIGCRLSHSQQWGLRVALESTLYPQNSFITLTYNPENLPKYSFLDYDSPVLFMKRLREKYGPNIRSFGCAEYGEKFARPHYHICLLNHDFSDKKVHKKSKANYGTNERENYIYTSKELSDLWPHGHCSIGSLTLESAQYVARYCTKKISGKLSEKHYEVITPTGEILTRPHERAVALSRARGLGYPWYEKYGTYVRDHDRVYFNGRMYPVPKFFDTLTREVDPDRFEEIKNQRQINGGRAALKLQNDAAFGGVNAFQRTLTIERAHLLKFKQLKRDIENG